MPVAFLMAYMWPHMKGAGCLRLACRLQTTTGFRMLNSSLHNYAAMYGEVGRFASATIYISLDAASSTTCDIL